MLIVVEKLYFRMVVNLPFDNQGIDSVLFSISSSAKQCALCRSTTKILVRKKYGRTHLFLRYLLAPRTPALFFCDFS